MRTDSFFGQGVKILGLFVLMCVVIFRIFGLYFVRNVIFIQVEINESLHNLTLLVIAGDSMPAFGNNKYFYFIDLVRNGDRFHDSICNVSK